jgi:hypothetical protein
LILKCDIPVSKFSFKFYLHRYTPDVIVEGDVEEIERMRRDLNLVEKGMVYVPGILEKKEEAK